MPFRKSFTEQDISFLKGEFNFSLVDIFETRRGSSLLIEKNNKKFILKIANKDIALTEIDILPPRSIGLKNEADTLYYLKDKEASVPKIFDYGVFGKIEYSIIEHIDGFFLSENTLNKGKIIKLILEAVKQIHNIGLIHGDLQLDHFIIGKSENKITMLDFEFSKPDNAFNEFNYPSSYYNLSPECAQNILIKKPIYKNISTDIYSLIITLIQYINMGNIPFKKEINDLDKLLKVKYQTFDNLKMVNYLENKMINSLMKNIKLSTLDRPKNIDDICAVLGDFLPDIA